MVRKSLTYSPWRGVSVRRNFNSIHVPRHIPIHHRLNSNYSALIWGLKSWTAPPCLWGWTYRFIVLAGNVCSTYIPHILSAFHVLRHLFQFSEDRYCHLHSTGPPPVVQFVGYLPPYRYWLDIRTMFTPRRISMARPQQKGCQPHYA